MKISIIGLGYVGTVSAACLARMGHSVIGTDTDKQKLHMLASGKPPVIEAGLEELVQEAIFSRQLVTVPTALEAVHSSDITIICVGTPSNGDGSMKYEYLISACEEVGTALKAISEFHVIVIRSTIIPGTMRNTIIPLLEKYSGKKAGTEFGVCNNPEFLREGNAIYDFYHPPKTVIGSSDARCATMVEEIYAPLPCPLIHCAIEEAEIVKYADNCWHATKVAFANEIGAICKSSGIDSHTVMEIFCQDIKLNISPNYLKPGFAFGGSCLPKDIRALTHYATRNNITTPLLSSLLPSNALHIQRVMEIILAAASKTIGILGVSFKAGTDDLRESPVLNLIQGLLENGITPSLYDSNVSNAAAAGMPVPSFLKLLLKNNLETVVKECSLLVITQPDPEFCAIAPLLTTEHIVIDLVRLKEIEHSGCHYHGICW